MRDGLPGGSEGIGPATVTLRLPPKDADDGTMHVGAAAVEPEPEPELEPVPEPTPVAAAVGDCAGAGVGGLDAEVLGATDAGNPPRGGATCPVAVPAPQPASIEPASNTPLSAICRVSMHAAITSETILRCFNEASEAG